jgi:hypothetical protein
MLYRNGHTVNNNRFNEKRTTMQNLVKSAKSPSFASHGHMPKQDATAQYIIKDRAQELTREDDGLLCWA